MACRANLAVEHRLQLGHPWSPCAPLEGILELPGNFVQALVRHRAYEVYENASHRLLM